MLLVNGDSCFAQFPAGKPDAFILDLEGGVPEELKGYARCEARKRLTAEESSQACHVRVSATEGYSLSADLDAVVVPRLRGINLPKVESASIVEMVDHALSKLERDRGLQPSSIELTLTLESMRGVERAAEIGAASPRVRRLCVGWGDLSADLGLTRDDIFGEQAIAVREAIVRASRENGLEPPHDGSHPAPTDLSSVQAEAIFAKKYGFVGKHAISELQLDTINSVFSEQPNDLAQAVDS